MEGAGRRGKASLPAEFAARSSVTTCFPLGVQRCSSSGLSHPSLLLLLLFARIFFFFSRKSSSSLHQLKLTNHFPLSHLLPDHHPLFNHHLLPQSDSPPLIPLSRPCAHLSLPCSSPFYWCWPTQRGFFFLVKRNNHNRRAGPNLNNSQ